MGCLQQPGGIATNPVDVGLVDLPLIDTTISISAPSPNPFCERKPARFLIVNGLSRTPILPFGLYLPPPTSMTPLWSLILLLRAIAAMELCRRKLHKTIYIEISVMSPTLLTKTCAEAADTCWQVPDETCRASGNPLRFSNLPQSHPFLTRSGVSGSWTPLRLLPCDPCFRLPRQ
jgi:hypothetical protein